MEWGSELGARESNEEDRDTVARVEAPPAVRRDASEGGGGTEIVAKREWDFSGLG